MTTTNSAAAKLIDNSSEFAATEFEDAAAARALPTPWRLSDSGTDSATAKQPNSVTNSVAAKLIDSATDSAAAKRRSIN